MGKLNKARYKMKQTLNKFALFLLRKTTDSKLVEYASSEFIRAEWCDSNFVFEDKMQGAVCKNVIDMLCVFSGEGHSGFSASYTLGVFNKVAKFKPLSPLTGADDEWNEVGDNNYQNRICGSIFKVGKQGKAYWLDRYVFRDKNGSCFTSSRSRQFIDFPWMPVDPEYIDVSEDEEGNTIYPEYIKQIQIDRA